MQRIRGKSLPLGTSGGIVHLHFTCRLIFVNRTKRIDQKEDLECYIISIRPTKNYFGNEKIANNLPTTYNISNGIFF